MAFPVAVLMKEHTFKREEAARGCLTGKQSGGGLRGMGVVEGVR